MTNAKSVFISYSSQDRIYVRKIVKMLEEEGIGYWIAPEMIKAGSSYAREIPRAIKNCEIFLLVLSSTSQKSIWVEKETDSAISRRKYIIPFQIDEIPLNDTFRFYLNNVQMIPYSPDWEESLNELREYLKQMLKADDSDTEEEESVEEGTVSDTVSTVNVLRKGLENTEKEAVSEIKISRNNIQKDKTGVLQNKFENQKRSFVNKTTSNALRMNRIPLECDFCGSKHLENVTMGTYRCMKCGKDSYDDYQTIRNYLEKVGTATAAVIERNTGVPKRVIEYFFREEYLEIPKNSPIRVRCESCGSPIRTGSLCEQCKSSGKKPSGDRSGKWHSLY